MDGRRRLVRTKGQVMGFVVRLLVNAAALWVATRVVPGVTYSGELVPFLGVALVFGIVNAFIRPVAKLLALPLIILTLGLFALIVNGLMLWLTSSLSETLGLGFHVSGFWAALFGSLIVSIVSTILWMFVRDESMR
jgi:putative membrane protein